MENVHEKQNYMVNVASGSANFHGNAYIVRLWSALTFIATDSTPLVMAWE